MILSELFLPTLVNEITSSIGIDTKEHCADKLHFYSYKKLVLYTHNSRGFRDDEWPEDLEYVYNNFWCVGDSFTVGLGQPQEEIWPYILKDRVPELVFNVSLNGASNDWISRKINYIAENARPKYIFVQWTYLHRREHPDDKLIDEDRRLHYVRSDIKDPKREELDFNNFLKNLDAISKTVKIVHSFIPNFTLGNNDLEQQIYRELEDRSLQYFPSVQPLDRSRDGHHYDVKTATKYVDLYLANKKNLVQNLRK